MEIKINIGYPQVLEMIEQLSEKDIQKIAIYIQNKYIISTTEWIRPQHTSIQDLIMQAPTWTDEEYNNYLEVRNHVNQSGLKF